MLKSQAKASKKASAAQSKQQLTKKSTKKPTLTQAKRTKISIGKGQRVSRAESMADNKAIRNQLKTEEAAAKAAEASAPVTPELPAVKLEKQKRQLISLMDVPRTEGAKQNEVLTQLADAKLPWTPVELGQITSLAANGYASNYQAASALIQDVVSRDFLPYKSSLRGLMRIYESAHHYKGANKVAEQFKNLYPVTEFDEVGMPISKVVLTIPFPDLNEVAKLPTSPESIDDILAFKQTLAESGQPDAYVRWPTEHHLLRQFLKNGKKQEAYAQLFHIFNRLGVAPTPAVPGKFDAIPFGTIFPKGPAAAQFKPDFPMYYKTIDHLIADGQWSAAMTASIYTRTLNRVVDVTPLRERTQNGQWRDYLDIHTHDGQTARIIVKGFLKELMIRRGYKADMEANVKGSEDAVTYSAPTRENALTYSPVIATDSEDLVILTDRSYNAKDIVFEKGGFEFTTANHIIAAFEGYGIKASLSHGSKLSSSKSFFTHYNTTDGKTPPNAPHQEQPVAFDLTVIVPKSELYAFAERKLKALPAEIKADIEAMPIISDTVRGHVKQAFFKEKKAQMKVINAQKQKEWEQKLIWHPESDAEQSEDDKQ